MKKLFIFAVLLLAFSVAFVACNKDNDGKDSGIVGTWIGSVDYHYPRITFKKDGTYEWMWDGIAKFKDNGTYTYENGTVVMTVKAIYEFNDEGDGNGKWDKCEDMINEYFNGVRRCKVTEVVSGGALFIEIENDYFAGGDWLVCREGFKQDLKKSDLAGTWEKADETTGTRMVLGSDGKYTKYEWWYNVENGSKLVVAKYVGTWSIKQSTLTIDEKTLYQSYKRVGSNEYEYYNVNATTLEADKWESQSLSYGPEDSFVVFANGKLYMHESVFTKK